MKKKQSGRGARLGQHFLIARWAAKRLVEAAALKRGDHVLEIGPGKGALTRELLAAGVKVIAIEKDEALIEKLRGTFAQELADGTLLIVHRDIRDVDPASLGLENGKYSVCANIPYYITGEIIRSFLTARVQPRTIALLVQKEVAMRIVSDTESILSLSVKAYGKPTYVARIPARCFAPPPKVDSAILLIEDVSTIFLKGVDEHFFFEVVRTGFASKRKLLSNNLAARFKERNWPLLYEACTIDRKARAENVSLGKWKCLALELNRERADE